MAVITPAGLKMMRDNIEQTARKIEAECRAYSNAAREGVADRWWKISLDDTGHPKAEPCEEPDYSCNGTEVADNSFEYWMWDMGWTVEKRWTSERGYEYPAQPDMMASIRDIARGR